MSITTPRFLITGGAGFIGSHIAEALLERGESVRLFDNLSTGREAHLDVLNRYAGRVEILRGDLRNFAAVQAAVAGVEVVFHEGALASVPRSIADPIASLENNVNGTQHVLLAARDARVRRVIFASSAAVYGNAPELPKREDMPPAPLSPYAIHKLTGEYLCQVFASLFGLETVALRYFNVFGPRQDPTSQYASVIPLFLTALHEGRQPTVFGDGTQTRDFTYIDDVVLANLLAASTTGASGQVINIGCGKQISLNDLLRDASEILGIAITPQYRASRPGDIHDSVADISRARQLLGYTPQVSFREGLARTIAALR